MICCFKEEYIKISPWNPHLLTLDERSNVNNRSPRRLTNEKVIDLFQSLEDEKTRLMWTMKVINLDLLLS